MAEERISWFPVLTDDELDEPERKLFAKASQVIGFVPNVFRTYAWRPERFRAWFAHFKTVMEGTPGLSAREREMISVVVSMANGCLYCLVAHGAALREQSDDKVEADRITFDYRRADLTTRERAILDYAVKVTTNPGDCEESDIEALRAEGLSDEDIWDVIEVAAMYNFTNRLAMASGMMPNREYHGLAR
ncbi:MAG TPA: peroxidase-related enzyme [Acidimicrobiia bacterium]|nr:peroxidase-related enzyme [Acidimicrobiia bacterium]